MTDLTARSDVREPRRRALHSGRRDRRHQAPHGSRAVRGSVRRQWSVTVEMDVAVEMEVGVDGSLRLPATGVLTMGTGI